MTEIEGFIKKTAPGGLYGEWAKKEECWSQVKKNSFNFDLSIIQNDLIDKNNPPKRQVVNEAESASQAIKEELEKIKSVPYSIWKKIEDFGYETKILSEIQSNIAYTLSGRVRTGSKISESERIAGLKILDIIIDKAPELLFESEEIEQTNIESQRTTDITIDVIKKMVEWDRKNKKLKPHHFKMMYDIVNGKEQITPLNKKYCLMNFTTLSKYGFKLE